MSDLDQRLAKLQKQFHGLKIMGGEGVIVHGSPIRGYVVEIKAGPADSSGGGGGGGPGPTPTGACCIGASCSVLTADDCATLGGTYQGDNAVCAPNPCAPPNPSCCYPDGHCEDNILESDCTDAGGASFGIFPIHNCADQGDIPCCVVVHVSSHITGVVCHQDSCDVPSCNQSVDLTAEFDTFLQNSNDGCCGDLLTTSDDIEIDSSGYHGKLRLTTSDNFDGTFNLTINWEITVDGCAIVTTTNTHNTLDCNAAQDFIDSTESCTDCMDCTDVLCACACPAGDCGFGAACGTYSSFSIETTISS